MDKFNQAINSEQCITMKVSEMSNIKIVRFLAELRDNIDNSIRLIKSGTVGDGEFIKYFYTRSHNLLIDHKLELLESIDISIDEFSKGYKLITEDNIKELKQKRIVELTNDSSIDFEEMISILNKEFANISKCN